jgi:formate dehydrogenase major subunit
VQQKHRRGGRRSCRRRLRTGRAKFLIAVRRDGRRSRAAFRSPDDGPLLSQYNVGAQTRRTANRTWYHEDLLEIHPHDASERGIAEHDAVSLESRAGTTVLRATITERVQPGVVYTTFHFPESGANVVTTESSDWATNCPEYKVTAVEVRKASRPAAWQVEHARQGRVQADLLQRRARAGDGTPP